MDFENEQALASLSLQFLARNYDYTWLKAMLEKASAASGSGATLITGSSHALNGIQENLWSNAINCSMHSQDIYYDFKCARRVLEATEPGKFKRCFIIMGYYIAFQDLSRSTVMRESMISNIYYPIFKDAHNWDSPSPHDPWESFENIPEAVKAVCEEAAKNKILEYGTYYSQIRPRGTLFDFHGKKWSDLTESERQAFGRVRAADHNKSFQHTESFQENKEILKEYVHFLYKKDILPIVVITPFTPAYNRYILKDMKEAVLELLDYVPEDIHYVDFNQASLFEPSDFMDTDHLSEKGAEKASRILVEMFGA